MALTQCYTPCEVPLGPVGPGRPSAKDYSQPLHVDCSVEYELPNAAKPPVGAKTEPLLMIHPCYYRRVDSQRQPFVNNLPRAVNARRQRAQPYPVRVLEPQPPLLALLRQDNKRDPLLSCGDYSTAPDSGISLAHWSETERSPLAPIPNTTVPTPDEKRPCPCGKPIDDRYSQLQIQRLLMQTVGFSRRQPFMKKVVGCGPPLLIH